MRNLFHSQLLTTALLLFFYAGPSISQPATDARLAEYRAQIDSVDRQIVELLNKRATIVHNVGVLKKAAGLPVSVPSREQQVLDRVAEAGKDGPLPPAILGRIYQTILREMRTWEAAENMEKK